jgi:hypothetical protein
MRTELPWGLASDEVCELLTASAYRGKLLFLAFLSLCVVVSAADYAPPSKADAQEALRAAVIETLASGAVVPAWVGLFGPEEKVDLVKADETRIANGTVVPIDTTYLVLKSPPVNVADGVMRLATPAGRLEVDWRGKAPSVSPTSP